ncbi:hypothetical protein [Micromonospora sp. NBC_01796]|uniref:hypothetical protein n=1 Tax=Micromonospora sp. NBC_01796 TaxID=2975987 RepID=UPI002DD91011|nr:hypothetical protein [Micromonospora sp. NBC_01796]WSA87390.1 hypothetical protein OIE47_07205 [Micromonospora sp. NBC_01796]
MRHLRGSATRIAFAAAMLVGIVAAGATPAAAAPDPPGACASCFTDPDERPVVIPPQMPRPNATNLP